MIYKLKVMGILHLRSLKLKMVSSIDYRANNNLNHNYDGYYYYYTVQYRSARR